MPHRFQLFGAPTLIPGEDAAPMALPFERRAQLLVLLALRRAWVPRTELATLLWPDQTDRLAAANLRKTLHRMQDLDWCAALQSEGGALRVQPEAGVDVHAFEQALREGRVPDALAMYRGGLLAGFDDDDNEGWTDWLHFERRRLQAAWRAAALEHVGAQPDAPDAPALCERLLEQDPLDEAALRLQMTVLGRQGQAARAHEAFRAYAQRLRDELDLAPGAELQALHEGIGGAALARTAAPAPVAADPGEAGFVGRAGERRRIVELLGRGGVRLLNLVGPGGIGKTRLAERAMHDLGSEFPGGTHFVRLEDVADAGEWVARIARETGSTLRGRSSALEQLGAALRERRMLLVFDNLEQLAEVAASVIDPLLAACPGVVVLVTSRVRLGLAGEQLLPMEGLPCPEGEDVDRVESFDAARLFIAAARRVEPGLLPSADAPAIVEICRLVDGLPLALELAAAWTRVISCEAIANALREGTELLRASDASLPARHASIEQVFEQSWQRLGAAEREALARLSVFQGGFNAEAARAVAQASLPVLGALADKSLLRKEGARLSLHPLVQQLASQRLDEAARAEARRAHMNYFRLGLARLKTAIWRGERAALDAVEAEMENHLHAWRWAVADGAVAAVREIGGTLQGFYDLRGPFEEGLALLRAAIEAPALRGDAVLQAWLVGEAAQFEYRLDRYAAAEELAQRALDSAERIVRQRARSVLGTCALRRGRFGESRRHFKQSLTLMDPGSNDKHTAATLDHLSLAEKYLGHFDEALGYSNQALAIYRRLGDPAGLALCLNNLGALYMAREDYRTGLPHLREAMALCEREGLHGTLPVVLSNLSEVEMHCDNLMAARGHAQRAGEIAQAAGNRAVRAWVTLQCGRIGQRGGDVQEARQALAEGLAEALSIGLPTLHCIGIVAFAELLCAEGDRVAAARALGYAARQPSMSGLLGQSLAAERQRLELPDDRVPLPIDFEELLRRIAGEAASGHEGLRGLLHRAERRKTARAPA